MCTFVYTMDLSTSIEKIKKYKQKYADYKNIFINKKILKSPNNIGYDPKQIYKAYGYDKIHYDKHLILSDIHVVIIIAYSYKNIQVDFDIFCKKNNLPTKQINIIKINENTPSNSDWSAEICIDTQWSHAIFPWSKITVVEAESDSVQDLLVAIEVGKSINPDIMNMSWGVSEFNFCDKIDIFNNSEIIFIASSGDDNSVEWPATNPNVLAVSASSLYVDKEGNYFKETTWSNSGCGYSKYFKIPAYQKNADIVCSNNRVSSDISIVGNPETGCYIFYDNNYSIYGGTSLSAPIISGTMAIICYFRKINNKIKINSNSNPYDNYSVQNLLYEYYTRSGENIFNDIKLGSSGYFNATKGWDFPTGLGSPNVVYFVDYLNNV
jgi:kumamolisin